MKKNTLNKVSLIIIVSLVLIFTFQLISDASQYRRGVYSIQQKNYSQAIESLKGANGYRDSEILLQYCGIMNNYDRADFSSVYKCYRELSEISDKLRNKQLLLQITRDTTEISTIYNNYNVLLCAE